MRHSQICPSAICFLLIVFHCIGPKELPLVLSSVNLNEYKVLLSLFWIQIWTCSLKCEIFKTLSNIIHFSCLSICLLVCISGACPNNSFPAHLLGEWYSIDQGIELQTEIAPDKFSNKQIKDAVCHDLEMIGKEDAQGNYHAKVLLYNKWLIHIVRCEFVQ